MLIIIIPICSVVLDQLTLTPLFRSDFETSKFEVLRSNILVMAKYSGHAGADLGGGGADALSSGIRPPADPKGPPLNYFELKSFLKAPSTPIYTNFEAPPQN